MRREKLLALFGKRKRISILIIFNEVTFKIILRVSENNLHSFFSYPKQQIFGENQEHF